MESIVYTTTPDPMGFFSLSKLPLNPLVSGLPLVHTIHHVYYISISVERVHCSSRKQSLTT